MWAGQFDRAPGGVLGMEGEIAQKIADAIESRLGGRPPSAPAVAAHGNPSAEAYDLYLKGQYSLNKRTAPDLETAIAYFRQSVAKDSGDARTYAALADAYSLFRAYAMRPSEQLLTEARAAALKALALDSMLPEAHTALALIVENYDWDWQTAGGEFRRAIALNPNYATAHHWYAEYLAFLGRFDEALKESERARQLDPLSLIIAADNGAILFYARQWDKAIAKWSSVLAIDPDFTKAYMICEAYVEKGMFSTAIAEVERWRPTWTPPIYRTVLAYVTGRAGQKARSFQLIRELLQLSHDSPIQAGQVAWAYAGAGDREHTLAWLEKAYQEHSNEMTALKVNPAYDPLRSDPRFQRLLSRVGLAQ